MSLRDKLREFTARRYKTVEIEGIGLVRLQSITEAERVEIYEQAQNGHKGQLQALLIIACLVDEENSRIYCEADVDEIMRLDSRITLDICQHIDSFVSPPTIEDAKKNSRTTLSDSGSLTSLTDSDTPA